MTELIKDNADEALYVADTIGKDNARGFDEKLICSARKAIIEEFNRTDTTSAGRGLKAALFDAIITEADDPDVSLPKWLDGSTPYMH